MGSRVGKSANYNNYSTRNYSNGVTSYGYGAGHGVTSYGYGAGHGVTSYGSNGSRIRPGNKTWTRNTNNVVSDTNLMVESKSTVLKTNHNEEPEKGIHVIDGHSNPNHQTSGNPTFILKGNNRKLVRVGAPPIIRSRAIGALDKDSVEKIPIINVDEIMTKYSISQHAANSISSDYITIKNKLVRKSILSDQTSKGGTSSTKKRVLSKKYCKHFSKGHCVDANCKFIHDEQRLMVCRQFLHGKCDGVQKSSSSCLLNHTLTPHNTPLCIYFLEGKCTINDCRYSHNKNINQHSPICTDFAIMSFCDLGERCHKKHLHLCPDYYERESCPRGSRCRLKHISPKNGKTLIYHDEKGLTNHNRRDSMNHGESDLMDYDEKDELEVDDFEANQHQIVSETFEATDDFIAFDH